MRRLALALSVALVAGTLAGCASDTLNMNLTSAPGSCPAAMRVVDAANPASSTTGWIGLGNTPVLGAVPMPAGWAAPGALLELKVEHPDYQPRVERFTPSALISTGRILNHHFVLLR